LRIALVPGEVALLRTRGASASRVLTSHERTAASLLPLLDEALADPAWHSQRVDVVLSQHFVRHVLTPPPGKALAQDEERALVTASLRDIYGDTVDQWNVQVISQPPQYGLVGAAIDTSLVQQLDALLARHGFRDIRIRPLASVAARRLPNKIQGWWALAEPGWLSLFGMQNGAWQHIAAQPSDEGWAAALPELIERETGVATLPTPSTVWVQGAGVGTVSVPAATNGRWQVLPHDNQLQGARALLGMDT
jgi:hypothetical protein